MFEERPRNEAPIAGSRMFAAASATVNVGKQATRQVGRGRKALVAIILYFQAVLWGFGALASMTTAGSIGQVLFTLALGCLISGGF
jgi:hypothetical protein